MVVVMTLLNIEQRDHVEKEVGGLCWRRVTSPDTVCGERGEGKVGLPCLTFPPVTLSRQHMTWESIGAKLRGGMGGKEVLNPLPSITYGWQYSHLVFFFLSDTKLTD